MQNALAHRDLFSRLRLHSEGALCVGDAVELGSSKMQLSTWIDVFLCISTKCLRMKQRGSREIRGCFWPLRNPSNNVIRDRDVAIFMTEGDSRCDCKGALYKYVQVLCSECGSACICLLLYSRRIVTGTYVCLWQCIPSAQKCLHAGHGVPINHLAKYNSMWCTWNLH